MVMFSAGEMWLLICHLDYQIFCRLLFLKVILHQHVSFDQIIQFSVGDDLAMVVELIYLVIFMILFR